jgi:hypothetical protein
MKCYLWCLVWGSVGLSTAFAQSASTTSQSPSRQKAYCEYSATEPRGYDGVYVDPDGNLYTYTYRGNDENMKNLLLKPNAKITDKKLEYYYSNGRKFIRKIKPEEWQAMLNLLVEASKGKMSEPKLVGFGPNMNVFVRCFVYNEKDSGYREVKLREGVSSVSENLLPSAKELVDWLGSLRKETNPKPKVGPNSFKGKQLEHEDSIRLIKYLTGKGKATEQRSGDAGLIHVINMKCESNSSDEGHTDTPSCSFTDILPKTPPNISLYKTEAAEVFKLIEKSGITPSKDGKSVIASDIKCMCGGFTGRCNCSIMP